MHGPTHLASLWMVISRTMVFARVAFCLRSVVAWNLDNTLSDKIILPTLGPYLSKRSRMLSWSILISFVTSSGWIMMLGAMTVRKRGEMKPGVAASAGSAIGRLGRYLCFRATMVVARTGIPT